MAYPVGTVNAKNVFWYLASAVVFSKCGLILLRNRNATGCSRMCILQLGYWALMMKVDAALLLKLTKEVADQIKALTRLQTIRYRDLLTR